MLQFPFGKFGKIQILLAGIIWFLLFQGKTIQGQNAAKENLGEGCNSAYSEINPIIAPDGKSIFFVRTGHPENKGGAKSQEIWFSKLNEKEKWEPAIRLESPFNLATFNAVQSISPDGQTILIKGARKKNKQVRGYSLVTRVSGGWGAPSPMEIHGLQELDQGRFNGGFLANDGQTLLLYFSESPMDDNCDLYISFLKKDQTWTRPTGLGTDINTEQYDEMSPFLASDGKTLYFSSNRPGGKGSHDIFMSRRLGADWKKWSTPVNLGEPANSEGWEAYYSIAASGDFAFITATENSLGKEDLVRLRLKEEQQPNPVVLVRGFLKDSETGRPIQASITYQILPEGVEVGQARSNPDDGSYQIVLPYGAKYAFSAKADGFFSISDHIDLSEIGAYAEIERPLSMVPIEVGSIVRLNNIFFETGKSTLRLESLPEIERVARLLAENAAMEIEIAGHTDDVGPEDFNLALSSERAEAVKTHLVAQGVQGSRISTKGFGESKPIGSNMSEEGKAINRRVEFTILRK